MASGRINLQANDGKVAGIVFEDGASGDVAVTVPKDGGKLAADSSVVHKTGDETIAGVKTFSNNTVMNGDVTLSGTGGLYIGKDTTSNKVAIKQSIGTSVGGIAITASNNSSTCVISEIDDGSLIFRNNAIDTLKVFNGSTLHISPSGGLGYGNGTGGTVTQLTSKLTYVTLNKPCGQIIMNNASLAANASVYFGIYNNTILSSDGVVITQNDSGLYIGVNYDIKVVYIADGLIGVTVRNVSEITLSDAVRFTFTIIKRTNS